MKKLFCVLILAPALALLVTPAIADNEPTGPVIVQAVEPKLSIPARDLPPAALPTPKEVNPPSDSGKPPSFRAPKGIPDPVAQFAAGELLSLELLGDPILSINGMGGANPNDTNGDIGPNHYVQMINSSFLILDRQGNTLAGPAAINALWTSADPTDTSECATQNRGDPIVLYDRHADRWLLSQFAQTRFICVAISQTADPTGAYHLYQFGVDRFPDYFKFGIWPDGYYVSANLNGPNQALAAVFDRANMLNGNPAGSVEFAAPTLDNNFDILIPSNMEGAAMPPAGTPNYMYRQVDSDILGGGFDRLELWEFHVDWSNPLASTFTGPINIATAPFNSDTCGYGFVQCIDQPGTAQQLDPIQIGTMYRFQYRNFGAREVMVGNFTVDANGSDGVGIRWFVLERSGGGAWAIANQGTYAPQPVGAPAFIHRWMGSTAMDRFGNMALGYTASSAQVVFPSARYTGRKADDPLGLMPQPEITIQAGAGSLGGNRWGDYYTMSVDPVDDCTFWYTGDYVTAAGRRQSRIASFRFSSCAADLEVIKSADPDPVLAGEQVTYTIEVSNHGPLDTTNVVVVDSLPDGFAYVGDSVPGAQCGVAGQIVTCEIGDIEAGDSSSFTITALVGSDVLQLPEPGGPKTFDNLVEADAAEDDPDEENDSYTLSTLVNELADLAVSKTCKPDDVAVVGEDDAFCEIVVRNNGPSLARQVTLDDEITAQGPYNVDSAVPEQGSCNISGGDVACDLGDIDAGDSVKVTVHVSTTKAIDINDTATAATETPESDYGNNSASGSIHFVLPNADLLVTKQCKPDEPAAAGSNAYCEIFVYNNGPSLAESVMLDDQIASDGAYAVTSITTSAGSCSAPGANVDVLCSLGDIADGSTVTVVVNFTANDPLDVNDIATATSVTDDPDPNNNTATGSVTFAGRADLSISKSDAPDPVTAGENLTYTLTVANAGPSTAVNVIVQDLVPAGTSMVSADVTAGSGSCVTGVPGDPVQPTVCGLGNLASGAGATITIVVTVLPDTTGVLHNNATVSSDTVDGDNTNNQASADTTVEGLTGLVVTKSDDQDPVAAGSNLKYTVTVTNLGPSTATTVDLKDTLPAQTSLAGIEVLEGTGACVQSATGPDVVSCTLGTLEPGDMFVVVITALVDASVPDGTTITNLAEVFENGAFETSATEDTLVVAVADLWIDKTGIFLTDNPSKTVRYTLTVHNDPGCSGDDPQVCGAGGPSDAQNVVVIDSLPSTAKKLVVTFVSEDCVYSKGTHKVTCTMGTPLAAGDSVFFEIEARPKGSLGNITNTASVSSSTTDPDSGNNSDQLLMNIGGGGQK